MSESSREPAKDRMILPVTPQADARARRFEHDVRRERNREYAVIIDNETGRVVGSRIRGERAIIQFTDEQLRSMHGRILSHNHPDGWRYPETDPRRPGAGFSDYDARMLADWGLAEIRAITPAYLYRLRPPADPASHWSLARRPGLSRMLSIGHSIWLTDNLRILSRLARLCRKSTAYRSITRPCYDWRRIGAYCTNVRFCHDKSRWQSEDARRHTSSLHT